MKRFLSLILILCSFCNAQSPLDTAHADLRKAQNAKDSIKAYQDVAWFIQRSHIDSSFYYNEKAQSIAERINDQDAINTNNKERAGYLYRSGKYEEAKKAYLEVLKIYQKAGDSLNVAKINTNLGAVYQSGSESQKAMESYINALRFFESDDKYLANTATTLANIGVLYKSMGNTQKALDSYLKAEEIHQSTNNVMALANIKLNLGGLYVDQKDFEKGEKYLMEARQICLETNNYYTLAAVDQNLGTIATANGDYDDALDYFNESLSIKTQIGDLNEAATTKVSIATIQTELEDYDSAVKNLKEAIAVFEENNNSERLLIAYPALNAAYIYMNEQDSAFVYLDKYTVLREELAREDAVRITSELDAKYEAEKKDRQLAEQRNEILKKELEVNQRNNMLILLGLVLLAAVILGYLLYRQQKLKNRQLRQEAELREAQAQLETQERLQQQRLRISRDLHDNIGSQLTFLISSLDNLKYAQNVSKELANEKLDNLSTFTRSTITELRDTIWAMNKNDISIQDLKDRLLIHQGNAQNAGKNFSVEFAKNVNVNEQFNSVRGMHYFRIVQEAINNAMKYAETDDVSVFFEKHGNDLVTHVKDHGKGFDPEKLESGNGLRNMKERAQLMEGTVKIKSEPEKGTEITISAPVN